MVITLDAFNKASNILYKASEKLPGERLPYQFIQETRPILILDEPQNMESEGQGGAAHAEPALRPALQRHPPHQPNLIYRLTPFDAYRQNLVKSIQVFGVTERDNANTAFLALTEDHAAAAASPPSAHARHRPRPARERPRWCSTRATTCTPRPTEQSIGRLRGREHRLRARGFVEFENGERIYLLAGIGALAPGIFREQIRKTIEQHMQMAGGSCAERDVKVLSLFFIDRVANYTARDGLIRRIFDEEFDAPQARLRRFSSSRRPDRCARSLLRQEEGKDGGEEAIDTESRNAGRARGREGTPSS